MAVPLPPPDPLVQAAFEYGAHAARGMLSGVQDHAMHSDPVTINTSIAAAFLVFATEKKLSINTNSTQDEVDKVVTLAKAFVLGFATAYDRAHPQQGDDANAPAIPETPQPSDKDDVPMYR